MEPIELKQFAAMNMIYNKYSFEYFLNSLNSLNVKNFELWTGTPHLCNFIKSLSDVEKINNEVKKRDMKIVCVTPEQVLYPYNIASANSEIRNLSMEYFLNYINMTAELGADKMLCCAGWGNYDEDKEEAWKRSVESLQIMTESAKKSGIILAFEILCPFESNLVNDLDSTIRIMEEIQSPAFKLCVDTVPVRLGGNTLEEFFGKFGNRICHVHMTDGTPTGHVPCGTGEHPIDCYMKVLSDYEYQGYITLEIGDTFWSTSPHEATKIGFTTVKKYMK